MNARTKTPTSSSPSPSKGAARGKKSTKPSKTMVRESYELALLLGWRNLNDQEIALIELLRFTTYHGRNIVMDLAITIRRTHPWVDGARETNISTTYPASDRRYYQPMKD